VRAVVQPGVEWNERRAADRLQPSHELREHPQRGCEQVSTLAPVVESEGQADEAGAEPPLDAPVPAE
jgi:hypothetical protein